MTLSEQLCTVISDRAVFIGGVISGILSGVVVAACTWWLAHIILSPRIKISRDIAFEKVAEKRHKKDSKGKIIEEEYIATVYRFKIVNNAFRNAFDINIFLRIKYKGQYAVMQAPYQPFLNRRKIKPPKCLQKLLKYTENYQNHRLVPFRMTDIRLKKIEGFKNETELVAKHVSGELCLDDFKDDNTIFEIIVNAVDSISGSALRVVSQEYTQRDLDRHVKKGKFLDGEMVVRNEKSKTPTT